MGSNPLGGCLGLFLKNFFSNFCFHIKDSIWGKKLFLSIVQAVMEVLNKSHFSLQTGNCPIPVAEHSEHNHRAFKNGGAVTPFMHWTQP